MSLQFGKKNSISFEEAVALSLSSSPWDRFNGVRELFFSHRSNFRTGLILLCLSVDDPHEDVRMEASEFYHLLEAEDYKFISLADKIRKGDTCPTPN